MEESAFETLLRKAAQQGTRREALGALVGGALLLGTASESDANKKAKRRKKRKHKHAGTEVLKDVSFWVNNRAGTSTVSGPYGGWLKTTRENPGGCFPVNTVNLAPGAAQRYFANSNEGYVFLNGLYWFDFDNWAFQFPKVSAAYGGRHPRIPARNCPPLGTTAETRAPLDVGDEISITVGGKVFKVKRYKDTSSNKIFEVIVPAGL